MDSCYFDPNPYEYTWFWECHIFLSELLCYFFMDSYKLRGGSIIVACSGARGRCLLYLRMLGLSLLGLSPLGLSPLGLSPLGLLPPSGRGSSGRGSSGRGSSGRGSPGRGFPVLGVRALCQNAHDRLDRLGRRKNKKLKEFFHSTFLDGRGGHLPKRQSTEDAL